MSMLLNALPSAMSSNPLAQRLLAQSGNAAYAGRGAYRVHETDPERKGDYWFRDFGMVMACTYMTEMGFRGTERFYTIPLLADALQLNAMRSVNANGQKRAIPEFQTLVESSDPAQKKILQKLYATHLYPQALNYSEMPDALRQKMVGTLVRNSSDVVGQVLQKDALDSIGKLAEGHAKDKTHRVNNFYKDLRSFIEHPLNPDNEAKFNNYLQKGGLNQEQLNELRQIAKADNEFAQQDKLNKFLNRHQITNPKAQEKVQDTFQVIQNRQMGYLINHLDRTLNFQHYVESNYLQPRVVSTEPRPFEMPASLRRKNQYSPVSELGETISGKLSEYSQTLHDLQNSAKGDLRKVALQVRKEPLEKRDEVFNKLIAKVDSMMLLNKKESLIDFNTSVDKTEGKKWQETYQQLWEYSNNIDRKDNGVSLDQQHQQGINWQNDYYKKRAELRDYLLEKDVISKKDLDKQLEHFSGFFEQMKTKLEIRNYQLEKIWHQLGTDLLVSVKKKIKDAAQDLNKIPDDHLPELASSIAARVEAKKNGKALPLPVRASRVQVMEARLRDIGLAQWDELTQKSLEQDGKDFIRQLAESLVEPLVKPKTGNKIEHYANESVMDRVKKEIFAQLTAFNKLDPKKPPKGVLFKLLCGDGLPDDATKGSKNSRGLEALLKPLLNPDNLHQVPDRAGNITRSAEWTMKSLILDGVQSQQIKGVVNKIQSNGTWPKMAATVALNFIFYGWLASRFDNKVLQPYEEKLVARKGTSQDIVNAGYLGALPGVAILSQLFDKTTIPALKKMNHFTRFTTVGGLALGTFAASTYGILKVLDKKTPGTAPSANGQAAPLLFRSAGANAFRAGNNGNPFPGFGNPAPGSRLPFDRPASASPFNMASAPRPSFQPYQASRPV